tara:strand:+ start:1094 stop:1459 length:366 start_codon:yes stop_codon:yes gene_type:complete
MQRFIKRFWLALVAAGLLAGCSTRPVEQCLQMGGAFHAAQLGVEGAMYADALTAKQEGIAKKVSSEGTKQVGQCRAAAVSADGDGVAFATSFLRQATLQLTPMLLDTPLPALPEFPEGGPK